MATREEIAALVKLFKQTKDEKDFIKIYEAIGEMVYFTACSQLGDKDSAKDVSQEVFMIVYKGIHKLEKDEAFLTWLNRIVIAQCNELLRKTMKHIHAPMEEMGEDMVEDREEFLPEEVLLRKDIRESVITAIDQLPYGQKTAILLYYYNNMTAAEIGEIMGTTEHAVHIRMSRARSTIRQKILKDWGGYKNLYTLTPTPVLTHIFLGDAKRLYSDEVRGEILNGVRKIAFANPPIGAASVSKPAGTVLTASKAAIVILSAAAIAGGAYLYGARKAEGRLQVRSVVTPLPEASYPAPTEETVEMEKGIETLEDMVGDADAKVIRSFYELSPNRHDEFMRIIEEHSFEMLGMFVEVEIPDGSSYVMYALEKEDKRLLLCEYYKSMTDEWQVKYALEDIEEIVPEESGYRAWFLKINEEGFQE